MQYASSHLDVYHLLRVSKNMMWLGRGCVIFQITHSVPTLTITTIVKVHFCAGNKSVQPTVDQPGLYVPSRSAVKNGLLRITASEAM